MDYRVPSVALAARALKLLSRHKYQSSSLKDIADKLQASPTTCLRVLRTLEQEDFIHFDAATKRYCLGPYLIPLGHRAAELNDAVARATHAIKRLAAETGLTMAVVQRWDNRMVYIAAAEPPPGMATGLSRLSVSVGQQTPLTSGAHGRCFLAFEDEAEWRRVAARGLPQLTPATITDTGQFVEALREVRRNGYAISHGEFHMGASAVDVPVFGAAGRIELVIAGMYVTPQMDQRRLQEVTDILLDASRKLSEWSGYLARAGDDAPPHEALA